MDIPCPFSGSLTTPSGTSHFNIPPQIDDHGEHRNCSRKDSSQLHWRFTTQFVHSSTEIRFIPLDENFEIESINVSIRHERVYREIPFKEFIRNNFIKFKTEMDRLGVPRECYIFKVEFCRV